MKTVLKITLQVAKFIIANEWARNLIEKAVDKLSESVNKKPESNSATPQTDPTEATPKQ